MHASVLRAINVQINSEFGAWYQYLAMAAFCEREKFTGAAAWLKTQSNEEYMHGMKLFDFVHARNEFNRSRFFGVGFEIIGNKQHLASGGVRIEHGNANDLSGEGVKIELPPNLIHTRVACRFFRQPHRIAK